MTNGDRTAAACVPSHRNVRRRVIKEGDGVDSISSLPDEILQHILCFVPTKSAVTTSLLSRRWRQLWCDTPSISFESSALLAASRMETQNRYTAPKMTSLHLRTGKKENVKHINTWIELAMSRHVEIMSLELQYNNETCYYDFPDFFFMNSSVKELRVALSFNAKSTMIPKCSSVSWTSLKKLSFRSCSLSDKSIAMILSGCPILEFLKLDLCHDLRVLNLSNSLRLRTLQVERNFWSPSPMQIVAPHVRCLKLKNSLLLCNFVDLSSLAEAKLNICLKALSFINLDFPGIISEMLEKLQKVEKLTFGRTFLQILSSAKICSAPFPMFKIKALTLETPLYEHASAYVMPHVIEKLLRNSPNLKKLTIHTRTHNAKPGLWKKSRWEVELKHVASFVEHVLKITKTLEKMVVQLDDRYFKATGFKEMDHTLSHNNNNVSIVFSAKPTTIDEW